MKVLKRNGSMEDLDIDKFHRVIEFACEGISGVSVSEIALRTKVQFYDGISTSFLMEATIKAAVDLISEDDPNYQWVASNLINYHLRKVVYGSPNIPALRDHVQNVTREGYYDPEILSYYTDDEWKTLNILIDHDRDFKISYCGMEQLRGKYLVKNRVTGKIYETPQMIYMLIAAILFRNYPKETRMRWVKDAYDCYSTFDISLPTPVMSGVRTPMRQFASCVLIETDDSLDSINATSSAIVKYVSQRAGIGIGAGRIRALGSKVRNGDTSHTGVIPFWKHFQSAVKSCSQGGVRGGAATVYYPLWHLEVEDLLVLKNNKGTEDNRIRHLDYSVQVNKVMYERLLSGGNITLFCPNDVPDLWDAFFSSVDRFRTLYERYEKDTSIRKKTIPASLLFSAFMQERKDTGRIYLMNVDHCNDHGPFIPELAPIRMSNLCLEITQPTKPLQHIFDTDGEISLCSLAALNWGKIRDPKDFEKPCQIAVRTINEIIDYQDYPVDSAYTWAMKRRNIGIGIINYAYFLAKNGFTYQDPSRECLEKVHAFAEGWSYYITKASLDMAKERGPCPQARDTKYSLGILPIDTYKRDVDELVTPKYMFDWDKIRDEMKKVGGLHNSTLMAGMPAETSAQLANGTNGIEPPRAIVSVKQSKDGVLKQVVPEPKKLKNKYDLLWNQKSPEGYLKHMAVLQKFMDQSISINTTYNPKFYPNEEIPMSELLKHIIMHYKYGGKTLYYFNTADGAGEIETSPDLVAGEVDEEDCEACKL